MANRENAQVSSGNPENGALDAGPLRSAEAVRRPGLNWWQAGGIAVLGAALVNLAILFIGQLAGASFRYTDAGELHAVTAGGVLGSTVIPLVIGFAAAVLLAHFWTGFLRLAQVIGGGFALLTVAGPFLTETDGGTQVALALMHVVVAVAVVWSLETVRRRKTA
jgi:hypothetical protein